MNEDFRDILELLLEQGAAFVVVGAHALAVHGAARATGDIDLFVQPTPENAAKVCAALRTFGAPLALHGVSEADFATPGVIYQLGLPPRRLDQLDLSMGTARSRRILTLDEYFDVELRSEAKHEFLDGEILGMSGGSPRHNAVARNLVRILASALRGRRCSVFGSDQRVATPDQLYTYPDLSVFCGPMVFVGGRPQTATNPSLLVEVLSDSTRDYDRGEKLDKYKRIPSLTDILLVEPSFVRVEHWARSGDDWTRAFHLEPSDELLLVGCQVSVPVAEIYEDLDELPD